MANEHLDPTLSETISDALESAFVDVHTALPGRVKSYDASKQTADVEPMIRRAIRDTEGKIVNESLPVIPNVPIAWMRGGGFIFHFPLAAGDFVLLIFSEAATAQWRESGTLSDAGDITRHGLSYAFAIPGIAPNSGAASPTGANVVAPTPLSIGNAGTAQFVALEPLVSAQLGVLKAAIAGAAVVAGDGGAAFKAAIVAALSAWPATMASAKLKAE